MGGIGQHDLITSETGQIQTSNLPLLITSLHDVTPNQHVYQFVAEKIHRLFTLNASHDSTEKKFDKLL